MKPGNQYEFFKNVELTVDGKLMVSVDNMDDLIQALNQLQSGATQTTVTVEEFTYTLPKTIVTTVTQPIPTPQSPPIVYNNLRTIVTPPPVEVIRVIGQLTLQQIYPRICGSNAASGNSKYLDCLRCVDKFIADNPTKNTLLDYTSRGTGCTVR